MGGASEMLAMRANAIFDETITDFRFNYFNVLTYTMPYAYS